MIHSEIIGHGYFFPDNIVTNDELSKKVDTNDEWIRERTGIETRRIASKDDSVASMGAKACNDAIKTGGIAASDIDAIILATTTPDHFFPSTASKIQYLIGADNAFAFDIQAVCSGFLYALSIADSMIKTGAAKNVLVVGADMMSRILDWTDRSTCILFGDGAGAVLLRASENEKSKILSTHLFSDGSKYEMLYVDESIKTEGSRGAVKMNGRTVFISAVEKMTEASNLALEKNNISVNDVDWFVAHQANKRIIDSVSNKLGIPEGKSIITVDKYANTSAATIPSTLSIAANDGRLKKGDVVLLTAIGGGFAWGSALLKW